MAGHRPPDDGNSAELVRLVNHTNAETMKSERTMMPVMLGHECISFR
jgi:hypothetical protein